ncbi:transketolase [Rubellicoccus peritrichatus]|uniref:Transketolase n=1 Tax=Rubellicoccus peritrichatus TaxID=3080537 RepID=A0AAQ3QPV2_9BACT|nr:transketolase [Puniceicoccus sp. CR14]WOO39503.1 transketolase [Puniceicoccus sp. CR14]
MPETMELNTEALAQACTEARGLAMDAVAAAASGHLGLPLGSTEIGAVLFGKALSFNPEAPEWINRDRFVLSAGHGSMFIYTWLHLAGYDLSLEELKNFRQLHSKTPGHPEFGETVGIEATTGPLGQGTGNVVGMAVSAKMAAAHFNTPEHTIFDHHIVALAGDGCLQEGIAAEAGSFAGRFGLDNLIMFYDSNDVTLDAMADKTQNEDTAQRYESYGWDVVTLADGHDLTALLDAYEKARDDDNGRPKLIICKTEIGRGIPQVAGTQKAHGEGGVKFVDEDRKLLGLPEEKFYVSEGTREYFADRKATLVEEYKTWEATYTAWKAANPEKAQLLEDGFAHKHASEEEILKAIPTFDPEKASATRASGGEALNAIAKQVPLLLSGSADLHGSTKNYIKDAGDFDIDTPTGRNLHFGIREHAMGAIMNGMAYYGLFKASGATFLTFSDYMRPSVRLAALANLPVFYIWTHDSIGVGEDGPTHQPVETVTALRTIPNLDVYRPGDAEETAAAFAAAIERSEGPTALILSRQNLPNLKQISVEDRRNGALKGGYVAIKETSELEAIILATGSELYLAVEAAEKLGSGVRVVSLPCWERFERQSQSYQDEVLPPSCTKRVSIEAGVTLAWARFVGSQGKSIGVDRFGISAPAPQIYKELGVTADAVVEAIKAL